MPRIQAERNNLSKSFATFDVLLSGSLDLVMQYASDLGLAFGPYAEWYVLVMMILRSLKDYSGEA